MRRPRRGKAGAAPHTRAKTGRRPYGRQPHRGHSEGGGAGAAAATRPPQPPAVIRGLTLLAKRAARAARAARTEAEAASAMGTDAVIGRYGSIESWLPGCVWAVRVSVSVCMRCVCVHVTAVCPRVPLPAAGRHSLSLMDQQALFDAAQAASKKGRGGLGYAGPAKRAKVVVDDGDGAEEVVKALAVGDAAEGGDGYDSADGGWGEGEGAPAEAPAVGGAGGVWAGRAHNRRMHPRNLYASARPDFRALAEAFPSLAPL